MVEFSAEVPIFWMYDVIFEKDPILGIWDHIEN